MNIASALFGITEHVLGIYKQKEARKYLDRVIYLNKKYREEENKDENIRNHALMDNIISELCIIADASTKFKE
jgi:hypothetical protein